MTIKVTKESRPQARLKKYQLMLLMALLTLIYALMMPDRGLMWTNYWQLLQSQVYLTHDFFEIAGLSATYLNVATHFLVAACLLGGRSVSNFSGLQIAALGIFIGHAFFGTHLLNMWPMILGVMIYSHWWAHYPYRRNLSVSLFTTAAGPLLSFIAFSQGFSPGRALLAIITGLFIGFISVPIAEVSVRYHQGFTLYNYGFSGGVITMIVAFVLSYLDWQVPGQVHIYSGPSSYLIGYFFLIVSLLLILASRGKWRRTWIQFRRLIKTDGRPPSSYIDKFGFQATALNMVLTAGSYLLVIMITGLPISGVVLGGLFSVMGFAAFGKHPLNSWPVSAGVFLGSYFLPAEMNWHTTTVAMLFGTALAPIAGHYGPLAGLIAGILHSNMIRLTPSLHLGLYLYNNGMASGFVAAFLAPIIEALQDPYYRTLQRERKAEHEERA